MPTPRKSQKQIAQRYSGNRRYFGTLHSFRLARLLLFLICGLVAGGLAWIYLYGMRSSPRFEALSTAGPISQSHARFGADCKECHDPAVKLDPLKPAVFTASIDARCETCHTQHTFHNANVVVSHSCTDCHHEHMGKGPMQPVTDLNCTSCHGKSDIMMASAQKGLQMPADQFHVVPADASLTYFQPPRPPSGYTHVFTSFEGDHPDFQIQREKLSDPNTLQFNHHIHLSGDIPMVDGKKLDCAYCHKPDSRGAYMQPTNFAKNCQACHSLQIDPSLADFQIPHPTTDSPNSVRDFLLTLPNQYATYAAQKKKLTSSTQIAAFVNQHMTVLRQRTRRGEDLEKEVFFSDSRTIHVVGHAAETNVERALFPGCAYCHDVKPGAGALPTVTKPVTPDRWFVHAKFDHAAHIQVSCESCHGQVLRSEKTADISMPDKASCVTCHSTKGGVVATCATCHDFHNKAPMPGVARDSSLRDMMLAHP